ncbi:MAG TPA: RNA polymerase sigma-70 factor [Cyclobacteriaceae bacterium]
MGLHSRHDEEFLFASIRKGDKEAFAELFNRYWNTAFFIAYQKLRDQGAAEEVVQDLFISLWNKRESLAIHNFSSYLYACVKNKCLNYIESKIIEKKHWDYYKQFIPQADYETEKMVSYNTLLEAINTSMESLPKKTRRVFQLNRLEGRSVSEIANALNLSEKAIEYHLARSLKHLRMHLKDFTLLLVLTLPI